MVNKFIMILGLAFLSGKAATIYDKDGKGTRLYSSEHNPYESTCLYPGKTTECSEEIKQSCAENCLSSFYKKHEDLLDQLMEGKGDKKVLLHSIYQTRGDNIIREYRIDPITLAMDALQFHVLLASKNYKVKNENYTLNYVRYCSNCVIRTLSEAGVYSFRDVPKEDLDKVKGEYNKLVEQLKKNYKEQNIIVSETDKNVEKSTKAKKETSPAKAGKKKG